MKDEPQLNEAGKRIRAMEHQINIYLRTFKILIELGVITEEGLRDIDNLVRNYSENTSASEPTK